MVSLSERNRCCWQLRLRLRSEKKGNASGQEPLCESPREHVWGRSHWPKPGGGKPCLQTFEGSPGPQLLFLLVGKSKAQLRAGLLAGEEDEEPFSQGAGSMCKAECEEYL